ncbi:ATP-dependent endonuclease [Microbacterium sp. NPDC057659]|uniref:ATP-dependent endonuclease n=1 Tax=Microbacterium sp. NPDC057659 TaxID=3346198 RepID=UPI00366F30F3
MSVAAEEPRTVVLFEGRSDRLAFEAVARRLGVDVAGETLVELGGITNLRSFLTPRQGTDAQALGLYDGAERQYVARVLRDIGMLRGDDLTVAGFFACERDLEEEVIRAAGPELVLETLAARGELTRFRVFQRQPAQRVRSLEEQLHRFAGTASGRKSRFAADVIEAVPIERMPGPLVRLLDSVLSGVESAASRTASQAESHRPGPS